MTNGRHDHDLRNETTALRTPQGASLLDRRMCELETDNDLLRAELVELRERVAKLEAAASQRVFNGTY